jgi:hypothetical protein
MSKFLQNLLVQISKALVYSKNQILFGKEFSCHFQAIRPFGTVFFLPADFPSPFHWASAFRPAQPTRTAQLPTFLLPPAPKSSVHGAAAGRPRAASTVALTPPPEEKNGCI